MKLEPYWASPDIKKIGLSNCISSCSLQPAEKILKAKRKTAKKICQQILKKDSEAEIVGLLGSVALGDIIGWFSDIDMLVKKVK